MEKDVDAAQEAILEAIDNAVAGLSLDDYDEVLGWLAAEAALRKAARAAEAKRPKRSRP